MPPKRGGSDELNMHPRAVAKREREAAKDQQNSVAKAQAMEDAKWSNTATKKELKSMERQQQQLAKQNEQVEKRQQKKLLQAEEDAAMSKVKLTGSAKKNLRELGEYAGTGGSAANKITQFELQQRKEREEAVRQEEEKEKKLKEQKILVKDFLLIENTNKLLQQELSEDVERYGAGNVVHARDIDSAIKGISLMNVDASSIKQDRFPEKRRKQAYKDYEKKRIPEIRLDHPELKLSQIKERIFKEFQTSPENPMNQQ